MDTQFTNVTIVKKANSYFDGNVTSRTVLFADGTKKTLGIILPGVYKFGTADKEIMEILGGTVSVKLQGSSEWVVYKEGTSFTVNANSSFEIKSDAIADYCCSYIKG